MPPKNSGSSAALSENLSRSSGRRSLVPLRKFFAPAGRRALCPDVNRHGSVRPSFKFLLADRDRDDVFRSLSVAGTLMRLFPRRLFRLFQQESQGCDIERRRDALPPPRPSISIGAFLSNTSWIRHGQVKWRGKAGQIAYNGNGLLHPLSSECFMEAHSGTLQTPRCSPREPPQRFGRGATELEAVRNRWRRTVRSRGPQEFEWPCWRGIRPSWDDSPRWPAGGLLERSCRCGGGSAPAQLASSSARR